MNVEIRSSTKNINCTISLSGSKSITNRVLIIQAVSGLSFGLKNCSDSEDSQLLKKALAAFRLPGEIDVNHAGTSFRFLTALLAVTEGNYELTGSARLKQRPVGELVEVLRKLGAEIEFTENEGFPPLTIKGKKLPGGEIAIRGDISSQFITALLLIAPAFSKGLKLTISTPLVSGPYVEMTIRLMQEFGIAVSFEENVITVQPGAYSYAKDSYTIEGDWSSAGYWYEIAALSETAYIRLENLFSTSKQADKAVSEIFSGFGVKTSWLGNSVLLKKSASAEIPRELTYDFTDCPDAAQTVSATCAGLGIKGIFSGLQTLKIKETDRIAAVENELKKAGINVMTGDSTIVQEGKITAITGMISTYHDHRMALSFAPLALVTGSIRIEDMNVIEKSYPAFRNDLQKAGFTISPVED